MKDFNIKIKQDVNKIPNIKQTFKMQRKDANENPKKSQTKTQTTFKQNPSKTQTKTQTKTECVCALFPSTSRC